MRHQQAGSSRGWLLPALLSVVALVAATVLWFDGRSGQVQQPAFGQGTPVTSPSATLTTPPQPNWTPPPQRSKPRSKAQRKAQEAAALPDAGPPQGVVVESLGIDARVVPISTEGSSLDPPDDPQVLGWWSGGAPAGAAQGTALVTGHTVNAGGGAMDHLENVRKGAEIRVTTPRGTIRYVAESVQVLDKGAIARQAQQLFSQEVEGRLVLVTCEDWDGTGYRSNVVVTAVPA